MASFTAAIVRLPTVRPSRRSVAVRAATALPADVSVQAQCATMPQAAAALGAAVSHLGAWRSLEGGVSACLLLHPLCHNTTIA